jgi:probable F420-dependent oxidoreductase
MKFGLIPYQYGNPFEETLGQAVLAEELGYDSIWAIEHHGHPFIFPAPLLVLGAIAARTQRVTIGSYVVVLPLSHPVRVAEEAAQLDLMSNGRFVLGIGVGYVPEENTMFGVPYNERGARMEEEARIITRLWLEERITYEGRFFRLDDVGIWPRPVQKPRPKIWVGAWVEAAVRRSARIGDAWVPGPTAGLEDLRRCYGWFLDEWRGEGKDRAQAEIVMMREVFCAETAKKARELGGRHIYHFYEEVYFKYDHPLLKRCSYEELVRDRFIIGTPDECIRQIERFENELGFRIDHLLCKMHDPGMDARDVRDSMRLFGREVMPHFANRT